MYCCIIDTLQSRYNAGVGIHNIRPRYMWVALYRGILLRNKLHNVIKYEIGVHTQTALYPIPCFIGSRYIGSTVYFTLLQYRLYQ